MPLLFTMEMWWHGMRVSPRHQLVFLGVMLLSNAVASYFAGFRKEHSVAEAASESVSAVALGLVMSLVILVLIREVTFSMDAGEILGKVLVEAGPVSLGVTFANIHVRNKSRTGDDEGGGDDDDKGGDKSGDKDREAKRDAAPRAGGETSRARTGKKRDPRKALEGAEARQLKADLKDVGATLGGALLFAYNVAPTEEILLIATRLPAWQHLVVMGVSLLLCYLILYASGFGEQEVYVSSVFQHPAMECLMAYAVTLLVSLLLLSLIGLPEVMSHPVITLKAVVALSLVGVVGGAAGRLAI
ncbi:DUF2391 family protein [Chondromyces apiculatus]|uniref:Integral membrane protein n=1 Tax=Chondromyces apiculatus DSM 436 TaxID=1192034 RepID=A0A017SUH2_9BACT|nr:DUF2391 family protein [Chondromyces apiculatus]EYF00427.1 Hypothetical protein CAP_0834 [Chondromyces apiculatus DSM 436]